MNRATANSRDRAEYGLRHDDKIMLHENHTLGATPQKNNKMSSIHKKKNAAKNFVNGRESTSEFKDNFDMMAQFYQPQ